MPPETFLRGLELYPGFLSFFLFSSAFLEVCHGAACDNMYMWRGKKKPSLLETHLTETFSLQAEK